MQLVGANPNPQPTGQDRQPGIVNYFIGNDPTQWHTNMPTFGRVEYEDVYPGIDLAYYGNQSPDREGAGIEYDFIVSPGADPNAITLNFAGADSAEINPDGDLVLHTAAGDVVQQRPFTYQEVSAERQEVASRYVVNGRQVRFDVGTYDASRPLVIDPLVLGYSTYLGAGVNADFPGPSRSTARPMWARLSAPRPTIARKSRRKSRRRRAMALVRTRLTRPPIRRRFRKTRRCTRSSCRLRNRPQQVSTRRAPFRPAWFLPRRAMPCRGGTIPCRPSGSEIRVRQSRCGFAGAKVLYSGTL